MKTKNNWFISNISERFTNPGSSFNVTINPYPFKKIDFKSAVKLTVEEIANSYSNLYVALSGGLDSEFVLRAFNELNIPIIPIIVCHGNELENKYAYNVCKELSIDPITISVSGDEYIECFTERIYKKFNGVGIHTTQVLFAADYVKKNNGVLVTGNHLIGSGDEIISEENYASINEWDFYIDYTHPSMVHIDLLLYTLEIACASLPTSNGDTWKHYRSELYNIKDREKIKPTYTKDIIFKLQELHLKRPASEYKTGKTWSRSEFDNIFRKVTK
jgi:hypothetical protein